MKTLRWMLLAVSWLLVAFTQRVNTLEEIRIGFGKMASDKELCQQSINQLKAMQAQSATHLGYLGGLQTIWANHAFNPINKWTTFSSGKKNIERAIQLEPHNAELRFIRLSVQKNAPSFLGYNTHIQTDKAFLKMNRKQLKSVHVEAYVDALLNE